MNSSESFLMVIKDKKIDSYNIESLTNSIKNLFSGGYTKILLDMSNVRSIDNTFLNFLKRYQNNLDINLFNLDSNIMSILFLTKFNKYVKIYNTETEAKEAIRPIIKRNLSLVS